MRRFLSALVLVAIATIAHAGTSGQDPSRGSETGGGGGVCDAALKVALFATQSGFGANVGSVPTLNITPATAGLYNCGIFQAPCTGTFTKLACSASTGLASSVGECGIFDSTGATRIASTGALSTAAAITLTKTGLSYILLSGTYYLSCWADSATATVVYRASSTPSGYNNQYVSTTFTSGSGATQVAPFNEACVGSTNPYTCCTGAGTGTCLGMADRTGIQGITAASVVGPILTAAP